ncbi:cell envelope integrity protein TolA [Pseudomonas sp. MDMC216]|nr:MULTISPECIES: cell envelope integrity protein TolA [Pseudomonas]MBA4682326.1 cell envelope integrity protein TolA [Pseudomonas sp.]MBJ7548271.1 cell envelope integrity protein TolA [Pseudomonas sp. OA3]MBG0844222.1 cell envelope integrity protein TolA [Pseudomonas chengduensis]MBP3061385.1 cell envelope integrity protein TolA [Pseudomonas chengduensis]MDH0958473.1 cell envelope integrity protein TolA [Pseudomonas chengduensis]
MMQQTERSQSESYFWPVVWAVGLHVLMFAMLFVSFAFTPELPPARPVVQATLYQLQSQSQATTQTTQKVAGEAQKTSAPQFETERLEQKKAEEQKQAQAEAQKVAAAKKAEEQKQAEEARKAEAAKKAEADKAAEQKRQADIAKKRAEEEAKKKAAEEAKKKAAAEEAKKKAAAAEAAKKKAAEDARRKAAEDQKAAALAELLSDNVQNQQALAETHGDQVAGNLDDLIIKLITENWQRPMSARRGMSVELLIQMLPDGTVTNASVSRSSGDAPFDNSAVAAVRNVGRIPEMQQLDRATFDRMYRQRRVIFKPED